MSVCNEIKESRLLGSRVLQNRSPRWNSAALVTLLVVRRSGRADGESRGGGEAELTVSVGHLWRHEVTVAWLGLGNVTMC